MVTHKTHHTQDSVKTLPRAFIRPLRIHPQQAGFTHPFNAGIRDATLLYCSSFFEESSSTEDDRVFGWLSRLASQILILCLPFTFYHCGWMKRLLDWWASTDSILEDKELKKMHVDLQKRFPINHVCPKCLAALICGSAIRIEGRNNPSGIGWGGNDTGWLVTWAFPLRTDSASWNSFESLIQFISFCKSCIRPVSSTIVSWSSTNLRLAIVSKVELWISLILPFQWDLWWASCNFEFCCNNCSWRRCWSRRWSFSAWE